MTDLTGRTAIVTGSGRGIGKAIALRYAKLGADVAINDSTNAANAEQVVKEVTDLGARAVAIKADVSNAADVDRVFAETTTASAPSTSPWPTPGWSCSASRSPSSPTPRSTA